MNWSIGQPTFAIALAAQRGPHALAAWCCLVGVLVFSAWAAPAAHADVLVVISSDAAPYKEAEVALRTSLGARKLTIHTLRMKEASERGAAFARTDDYVAVGTAAARWLHQKLPTDARLVFCMVNDPGEAGLQKGSPTWGVTTEVSRADQLKLIAEALPGVHKVGLLYRADAPAGQKTVQSLQEALPTDWSLQAVAVREQGDAAEAINTLLNRDVDLIWTAPDPRLYDPGCVKALLIAGLRRKVPVWGFSPSFVRAGALMGVGVEPKAQGAQAAAILLRVMDGKAPSPGSVDYPTRFQIAVNLNVAAQIGVKIPEPLSARADFVFRTE